MQVVDLDNDVLTFEILCKLRIIFHANVSDVYDNIIQRVGENRAAAQILRRGYRLEAFSDIAWQKAECVAKRNTSCTCQVSKRRLVFVQLPLQNKINLLPDQEETFVLTRISERRYLISAAIEAFAIRMFLSRLSSSFVT